MNLDVLSLDRRSGALLATTVAAIAANALQVRQRAQASQRVEKPSKDKEPSKKSDARNGGAKLATAVDANFARRLATILQIIVPSWRSPEASILLAQTLTLLCRTLLSLRIARCGGEGIKAVMHGSLSGFARCLLDFSLTGLVAGVVNSALKFHTNLLTVRFRERLTNHVHERYCHGTRYYRAATLRSKGLDHLDQRVADDIHQFCATLADLHGRTFKPALDAVLCTHRMARSIGWKGLALLYGYYLSIGRCAALHAARAPARAPARALRPAPCAPRPAPPRALGSVTRRFSPPFARLIAQQQAHEGELRHCHARLVAHAEEVALLDGGPRERGLLDAALDRTASFSRRYYLLQFAQGAVDQARHVYVCYYQHTCYMHMHMHMHTRDHARMRTCVHTSERRRAPPRPQWTIKYGASLIGWPVLALPFLNSSEQGPEVAARYREADTLIQNACAPP